MASSNEAGFNLRVIVPLSRNILHNSGREIVSSARRYTRQRMNLDEHGTQRGYRNWVLSPPSSKDVADHLDLLSHHSGYRKERIGLLENRRLSHFAEFTCVNVGDSRRDAKESSPRMSVVRVGATIVVRDRNKPVTWRRVAV
jgi:hypothetical protein